MKELMRVLRVIPVELRVLGGILLFLPVAFLVLRMLGMSTRVACFAVVGLLVILLVVWGFNALLKLADKKRAKDFEAGLGAQAQQAEVGKEEIREALGELAEQWRLAVRQLRDSGLSIYDLPWYLLFGEPQSGKSTTLQNSGLEFPVGTEALSGAGGTRNCDWWFSDEAVILDTAGRFTFQEETAPDRHEWDAFLNLLRRHRKHCPINGAIVVIPATSLTEDSPEEQEQKARNIRQKLLNLQKQLEIRFPVFILVTKADRILGFAEFFSRLEPADQRQLFGWSNPVSFDKAWDPASFPEIFSGIVRRVHKLRLRLLRDETNVSQLDKLFVFPEELEAVREPLAIYLRTIFASSRFEEPFIFRGFYITSGVQQGRPIARACRDLLRVQVGDPHGVLEDLESVFRKSRAFFIRDFYEKKVFPEQGLITRTRLALRKDRTYRWVFRGLMIAAAVAAFLLLLPAAISLYGDLVPVNEAVVEAQKCLEASPPCDFEQSYRLIYNIEQRKRELRESKWAMRLLLRGAARNEITEQLLPAIQAGLFRRGVLTPLLNTFEARADPAVWESADADDYTLFLRGYQQWLSFRRYQGLLDPEEATSLRATLSVEPLLRFCTRTVGRDPSATGQKIDGWLATHPDPTEAEEIFRAMLGVRDTFDVAAVDRLVEPQRSHRTFHAYWSIENLARWEHRLTGYFRRYADLYGQIRRLGDGDGGGIRRGAQVTLDEFVELAESFAGNWDAGAAHMASAPAAEAPAAEGAEVAGEGLKAASAETIVAERGPRIWQERCRADYATLRSAQLIAADVEEPCGRIPAAWDELMAEQREYAYLYQEMATDAGMRLAWSEAAARVRDPLVALAELAAADRAAAERQRFEDLLAELRGDRERLEELRNYYETQQRKLFQPVDLLGELALTETPPELEVDAGWRRAGDLAALALALRVLPPSERYLTERVFTSDCTGCYHLDFARTHVPPTNAFLIWAARTLGRVKSYREVIAPQRAVDDALFAYLRDFAERSAGVIRGGGGGGFVRPQQAAEARRWSDFVRAIRTWRPIAAGGAATLPTSALTVAALEEFARENDRLKPLLPELRASAATAVGGAPRVSDPLAKAAGDFQNCVAVLEDDPLRAWKQLALERDDASLGTFHAFSGNRRLRDNPHAGWMRDRVEAHGAELLAAAIRPEFEERFRAFWSRVERCCSDRYPFITHRQLSRAQATYERGYQPGGIWLPQVRDAGRRAVTNILDLPTVDLNAIDALFFEGGNLDDLFLDFALDPIVEGETTTIDFVGEEKEKIQVLRLWQRFLYGSAGEGGPESSALAAQGREFTVKLLQAPSGASRIFLGERVGQVDLFGSQPIRPSTDATRGVVRAVPLRLDPRALAVHAINEDRRGWTGHLEIRGGALKLFYFVQLASSGRVRGDGRIYSVRVEIPDFDRPEVRPEGIFELTFDRPIPGVFSDR